MAFLGFAIREPDDGEDDRLYPLVKSDASGLMLDSSDGPEVEPLGAKGIEIYQFGAKKVYRPAWVEKVSAEVHITESRVAFACANYDKGGGWRGDPISMVVMNTASKIRAATRRRGKCLVGHVRYPWLAQVGFLTKFGWGSTTEQIRLVVSDNTEGDQILMSVDLTLGTGLSARSIAEDIQRRAIDFRLDKHPSLDEEQRQRLKEMAEEGMPMPEGKGKTFTLGDRIPGTMHVLTSTATYGEKD